MQRFLDRPKRFFAIRGLDQDQTGWIEAERVQAVAIKTAMQPPIGTAAIGRGDANQQVRLWQTAENGRDEAEGGCGRTFRSGHDFMECTAGQTAVRQVRIQRGQAQRQAFVRSFDPGQEATQFVKNDGAMILA
jgi:hypothetical protein